MKFSRPLDPAVLARIPGAQQLASAGCSGGQAAVAQAAVAVPAVGGAAKTVGAVAAIAATATAVGALAATLICKMAALAIWERSFAPGAITVIVAVDVFVTVVRIC